MTCSKSYLRPTADRKAQLERPIKWDAFSGASEGTWAIAAAWSTRLSSLEVCFFLER